MRCWWFLSVVVLAASSQWLPVQLCQGLSFWKLRQRFVRRLRQTLQRHRSLLISPFWHSQQDTKKKSISLRHILKPQLETIHFGTLMAPTLFESNNPATIQLEIHRYFLQRALQEAFRAAELGEVPIGAIVVRPVSKNITDRDESFLPCLHYEILSVASNRVERDFDASAHAELLAMRKAATAIHNWRLINSTVYSTLEPCPMCLAAMQAFRVQGLVYGAPDLRLGAITTHMRMLDDYVHPFHNLSNVLGGVEAEACARVLTNFFRQRRMSTSRSNAVSTEGRQSHNKTYSLQIGFRS